jgi:hypothetical protein
MPANPTAVYSRLFPGQGESYPWVIPPPGFETIDRNAAGTVAAGVTRELTRLILPGSNYEGWVVQAGIFAQSYVGFRFQIRVDGVAIRDYADIAVPLGQPDLMQILILPLRPNKATSLWGLNTAGAPIGFRFRLFGWYYPVSGAKK